LLLTDGLLDDQHRQNKALHYSAYSCLFFQKHFLSDPTTTKPLHEYSCSGFVVTLNHSVLLLRIRAIQAVFDGFS